MKNKQCRNRLFGTDGIRARANRYPLDVETAAKVGRAIAQVFGRAGDTIYIGQDTRLSSNMLAMAVGAGICSAGINACQLGVIPTAGVAYLTKREKGAAGVVISASHNPFEDNGIKVFQPNGKKASCRQEKEIEDKVFDGFGEQLPCPGRLTTFDDSIASYISFLKNNFKYYLKQIDIVIDCANGATSYIAPELFSELGLRVKVLAAAPDGRNINAGCGSEYPEKLAREVVSSGAAMGFAFDGDGDRLVAVDEKGSLLSGDHLLAVFASHYLEHRKVESKTVVSTIMSNLGLTEALQKIGMVHLSCRVGDRNVAEAMQESGAVLGGEASGHLILGDLHTTGDGLLAALMLLEAYQSYGIPLSELGNRLIQLYPQKLVNVPVSRKPPLDSLPEVKAAISRVEKKLGTSGRVLVRYSGTESLCRVMVEANDEKTAEDYSKQIAQCIARVIGE